MGISKDNHMKVGVFDSGIGGLSVANAIQKALPDLEVKFVNDVEHLPYGTKPPKEILGYVVPILEKLVAEGCQVIVIACNTVSTTIIKQLREYFSVPLIAVEPMVKPAAGLTKTGVIAICATPTTLASKRYHDLKAEYAKGLTVVEPDCSNWSYMIEHKQVDKAVINREITAALDQKADVIVLACTHYHWIEEEIKQIADGRAMVIQPEKPVVAQLKRVLEQLP